MVSVIIKFVFPFRAVENFLCLIDFIKAKNKLKTAHFVLESMQIMIIIMDTIFQTQKIFLKLSAMKKTLVFVPTNEFIGHKLS